MLSGARGIVGLMFQCRDQENQDVDWFIFYKIGRIKGSNNELIRNGSGFLYMDSNTRKWSLSVIGIDSPKQPIGHTLQQYYEAKNKPEVFSIMYNDEFPYPSNGTWSNTAGHTKGVVVFGENGGFWLIHSVPKFPRNDTYEYPHSARHYGQMGLCISMPYSQLGEIAIQLYYSHLFIYSKNLPVSVASDVPLLVKVLSGHYQKDAPYISRAVIDSTAGRKFVHFAKTGTFNKDLYFDLVAPGIKSSLETETWQHASRESKNLGSWCRKYSPYKVLDVKRITLPYNISFLNMLDHSKFAVATLDERQVPVPWICIGDINRQEHQLVRAGGTMCFMDVEVHAVYSAMVSDYWPCKTSKFKRLQNLSRH